MRIETRKVTIYKIDELKPEAREKALHTIREWQVDYDWYQYLHEKFTQQLTDIGIKGTKFYWSVDRDWYIFCEDAQVTDVKKFLKYAGWDLRRKDSQEAIENGLNIKQYHYAMGIGKNYVELGWSENELLTDTLNGKLGQFLTVIEREYDYITSEEAILENIEANEYEFLEDGSINQ